ncbi:hypothetical protein N8956_00135 [bacterium]|jgi:hypothetical protein|nr:hypothetical protein [bacterium]MDB4335673.1 hypothetical protein [bacterium]|tara:strand:+ start:734 stop:961 length:228 start_codon:yes stop_codon:yes gene_type:complete
MNDRLKVEGHTHLVREITSGGIVNTNRTEYQLYMKRIKSREQHGDQIRTAVKDINSLKNELREIKGLLKEIINGS